MDWWYDDSLTKGYQPWYIAFGVTKAVKDRVDLEFPLEKQQFYPDQQISFSWNTAAKASALIISDSPLIRPENHVFRTDFEKAEKRAVGNLAPGTYYWAIAAENDEGILCWSEVRSFEVVEKDFFKNSQTAMDNFPLKVYPNPFSGETVNLSFELTEASPVEISLFDMYGNTVYHESLSRKEKGIYRLAVPVKTLSGIGIVHIHTLQGSSSAKIVRQQ